MEGAMATRTIDRILQEWRDLERQYERATDADLRDGIEARIEQVRRQYREAVREPSQEPEVREPSFRFEDGYKVGSGQPLDSIG
jgi:hypothetical protein